MTKHWTLPLAFTAIVCLICISGCSKQRDKQDARATSHEVALVGDTTRSELLTTIASAFGTTINVTGNQMVAEVRYGDRAFRFLALADDSTASQAGLARQADLVLLAVDAVAMNVNQGPLPIHRELVLGAGQMAFPDIVIAFTNSHLIDDYELLQLEELEIRDLLDKYKLSGLDALCVFDHPDAKTRPGWKPPKGPTQIVQALHAFAKKQSPVK